MLNLELDMVEIIIFKYCLLANASPENEESLPVSNSLPELPKVSVANLVQPLGI